jgi:hypothetical protein
MWNPSWILENLDIDENSIISIILSHIWLNCFENTTKEKIGFNNYLTLYL